MPPPARGRRSDFGRTREVIARERRALLQGALVQDARRMQSWPDAVLRQAVRAVEAGDWSPEDPAGWTIAVCWFRPDPSSGLEDYCFLSALLAEVERRGWPAVVQGSPRPFDPWR